MSKIREKTTATLLIAVFMTSMLAIAGVQAGQYIVLDSTDADHWGAEATEEGYLSGKGSWKVYPELYPNDEFSDPNKLELYLPIDVLGTFKVDDIQSISYHTWKPGAQGDPDFYLLIYTVPDGEDDGSGWYGYRLNGEPYYSLGLNAPSNTWNRWDTNVGTNQLTFFDAWKSGVYGFYGQPTLQTLQAGTVNWKTLGYGVDQNIDYGLETVKYVCIQTGTDMAKVFTGYLDAIEIKLTDGRSATFDLEAGEAGNFPMQAEVVPAIVSISLTPTSVNFGLITPGYKTSKPVTITHDGNALKEKITVELTGDTSGFYQYCLKVDDFAYDYSGWSTTLAPAGTYTASLDLSVPWDYSPGTYAGSLVFWAEAVAP